MNLMLKLPLSIIPTIFVQSFEVFFFNYDFEESLDGWVSFGQRSTVCYFLLQPFLRGRWC